VTDTPAFNRINANHFDFVLCDKDELAVVCAIELNDKSHRKRDASIEPVTAEQADVAREAWRRYSKGRHSAALNFGD
jgi:uncharacterized protein with PIN domain